MKVKVVKYTFEDSDWDACKGTRHYNVEDHALMLENEGEKIFVVKVNGRIYFGLVQGTIKNLNMFKYAYVPEVPSWVFPRPGAYTTEKVIDVDDKTVQNTFEAVKWFCKIDVLKEEYKKVLDEFGDYECSRK